MSKTQLRWQGQPLCVGLTVGGAGTFYVEFPVGAERVIVFSDTDVSITYFMRTIVAGSTPTDPGDYPSALLTAGAEPGTQIAGAGHRILQANIGQIIESNVPFNALLMRTSAACEMFFEVGGAAGD